MIMCLCAPSFMWFATTRISGENLPGQRHSCFWRHDGLEAGGGRPMKYQGKEPLVSFYDKGHGPVHVGDCEAGHEHGAWAGLRKGLLRGASFAGKNCPWGMP